MDEVKHYEVIEVLPDGTERRRYHRDGSIRDSNGRIVSLSPVHMEKMHNRRREVLLKAKMRGAIEGTGTGTFTEAVKRIISERAKVAVSDPGRAGNDAARLVLIATEAYPNQERGEVVTHEYTIDPETKRFLVAMAEIMREREG